MLLKESTNPMLNERNYLAFAKSYDKIIPQADPEADPSL